MEFNEYHKIKQDVLEQPICYRTVDAKEIIALGGNNYSVGNATFELSEDIAKTIDRIAGITKGQTEIAHASYGQKGVVSLRNFFGQADVKSSKRLVLVANTKYKQIEDVIPVKNDMITPEVFFDFAEMFMNENQYLPKSVEYMQTKHNSISVLMKPVKEEIMEYAPGDEFLSNGLYLRWNPGEISLGNYYERLVCSNGSTQISQHSITRVHSPEMSNLKRLLKITSDSNTMKYNTEKMLESVKIAIETKASVRELGVAVNALNKYGIPDDQANKIIPYESTKEQYAQSGYPVDSFHMAHAMSDNTVWHLFNTLTYFATHNEVWSKHDIRRTSLMEASMKLLMDDRDIKEFYNIF